jgi:hypothetical protein
LRSQKKKPSRILEAKIGENAIGMLKGPWRIKCDKCGTEQEKIELTEQGISGLLSKGQVEIECVNPDCRRHRVRISLRDLIAAHVGK